uniref:Uncharacterized protein n=1 Tax=Solanum tuberosum TaxID=4113 RepID=M1C1Q3_SOLTU
MQEEHRYQYKLIRAPKPFESKNEQTTKGYLTNFITDLQPNNESETIPMQTCEQLHMVKYQTTIR